MNIPRNRRCCANCYFERFVDAYGNNQGRRLVCSGRNRKYRQQLRAENRCIRFTGRSVAYVLKPGKYIFRDGYCIEAKTPPVYEKSK